MRTFLRLWLAATTAALVWLVAAPAFAAAPLCDARGAITFAPNPKLDVPTASLDALDDGSCTDSFEGLAGLEQGRGAAPDLDFSVTPFALGARLSLPPRRALDAAPPTSREEATPFDGRTRLERPPRAG